MMRAGLRYKALLLGAASLVAAAHAFEIDGTRWANGETVFHVNMPGTSPSGVSWNDAFEGAMFEWSDKTAFNFRIVRAYRDPCQGYRRNTNGSGFPAGGGDGFNGVDFNDSVCGNDFGQNVIAITLSRSINGQLGFAYFNQSDIIFNSSSSWNVYPGPLRPSGPDFYRVALHELGHALGLGHEDSRPAIMASNIGNLRSLQQDDINGANTLYGGPVSCTTQNLLLNRTIFGRLGAGDCQIFQLYGGGNDTSRVDVYRLSLDQPTRLVITMNSTQLDPVLIVTDPQLRTIAFDDDSGPGCNARIARLFEPGEYLVLANTYTSPTPCAGNIGSYELLANEEGGALLGQAQTLQGADSGARFFGGASRDGGLSYRTSFSSTDAIDVNAFITVDPAHVGRRAAIHVLVILDDGRHYVLMQDGNFRLFDGNLAALPAARLTNRLEEEEAVEVARNFVPASLGLTNTGFRVYVGYALAANPTAIIHNGEPLRFTVTP